nr:GH3 auxin-responsive promoter family protein [Salinimicrobium tongyeongense]
MGIIDSIGNLVMKSRIEDLENSINNPHETQQRVLQQLLETTKNTYYGRKFHFKDIHNYRQFVEQVPLNNYEDLHPYIELILKGEANVLWPTPIKWFAKSSGTTGATSKIIPVSTEGLEQCHYQGGAICSHYIFETIPMQSCFQVRTYPLAAARKASRRAVTAIT